MAEEAGRAPLRRLERAPSLDELALCFRLQANLARVSALLGIDRERAGWFLAVAQAALEEPDLPLDPEVARELRRLLDEAARAWKADDVLAARSAAALAEGLCTVRMLSRAPSPDPRPAQ